jgi:hypothetical protein
MAREETVMGIGQKYGDPNNKGRPEMDPATNPLQLDGDANKKHGDYDAIVGDADHNISFAMKHFDDEWKNAKTVRSKLEHYNDGGNISSKGRNYASRVLGYMNQIRVSTSTNTIRVGR